MSEERLRAYDTNPRMRSLQAQFASDLRLGIEPDYQRLVDQGNKPEVAGVIDIYRNLPLLPGVLTIDEKYENMVWMMKYASGDDSPTAAHRSWLYANDQAWRLLPRMPETEPADPTRYVLTRLSGLLSGPFEKIIAAAQRGQPPDAVRNNGVANLPLTLMHIATTAAAAIRHETLAAKGVASPEDFDTLALEQSHDIMVQSCEIIQSRADPEDWISTKSREPLDRTAAGATNALHAAYQMAASPAFILEAAATFMPLYVPEATMPLFTGNMPLDQRPQFQQRIIAMQRDMKRNGLIITNTLGADKDEIARRAQVFIDLAMTRPDDYAMAVDDIHARIRLAYTARKLVDGTASGAINYGEVLRTASYAERLTLAARAWPYVAPEVPEGIDDMIVVDEEVPFTILAPGEGGTVEGAERTVPEISIGRTQHEIDSRRVRNLVKHIVIPWGRQYCKIIARSLHKKSERPSDEPATVPTLGEDELRERPIQNLYYIVLLQDTAPSGEVIWHAVGDHPTLVDKEDAEENAMYFFNAFRGIAKDGRVVLNWDRVMRDKGSAYSLGAEKVLHVGNPYERIIDRLLSPLKPLSNPERRLGLVATLATMRKNASDHV